VSFFKLLSQPQGAALAQLQLQIQTQAAISNESALVETQIADCQDNPFLSVCNNKLAGDSENIDQSLGLCQGFEATGGLIGFAGSGN